MDNNTFQSYASRYNKLNFFKICEKLFLNSNDKIHLQRFFDVFIKKLIERSPNQLLSKSPNCPLNNLHNQTSNENFFKFFRNIFIELNNLYIKTDNYILIFLTKKLKKIFPQYKISKNVKAMAKAKLHLITHIKNSYQSFFEIQTSTQLGINPHKQISLGNTNAHVNNQTLRNNSIGNIVNDF